MRRPRWIAYGLVALVTVTTAGQALAAPGAARSMATSAVAASAQGAAPAVRGVTLVTGETVRVAKDAKGRTIIAGLPATRSGAAAAFQTVTTPKHTYVIPASARPYLGRFLDPTLFDVAAPSGAGTRARIPVRLTFTGTAVPAVPGVTVTSSAAGTAVGYLTAASARRFGAALADQYRTDAKAHFPSRATLFGATKVLAGASAPPVVTPNYPMRTLIVKVLGSDGAPVPFGFVSVYNTDSFAKFLNFAIVVDGEARVSVPLGTYGFDTAVDTTDAAGNFGFAVVTKSDYVVSAQNQVVTIDGRTATSRLSVRTPRSADQQVEEFDIARLDAAGTGAFSSGYAVLGPGVIDVAPAQAPTSGTLSSGASWALTGSPLSGTPYAYSLHFGGADGIPTRQAYSVTTPQLATFTSRLYVDVAPRSGGLLTYPMTPDSLFGGGWSFPVQLPSNLVTYVNAIPGAVWFTTVFGSPDPYSNPFAGAIDDGPRLAPAGTTSSADWGRGPVLPNVPVETTGSAASGFDCPTCRTARRLQVALNFATDSTPGHSFETFGSLDGTPVARLRIYRNGTLISDKSDTGFARVAVPATSGTYRILDEVDRRPSLALQSLTTRTEITFVSAAGQGGSPPSTWTCSLGTGCAVLPLLRTAVELPTNLVGSVPLGTSSIDLTVSHIQGAPATAITGGLVEIRRPGGAWMKLPIRALGAGTYRATLTTTTADAGSAFDLRVTGADAARGRIVQTSTSAFAVAGS